MSRIERGNDKYQRAKAREEIRCEFCMDTGALYDTDGPPFDINTGGRKMKRCPNCNRNPPPPEPAS